MHTKDHGLIDTNITVNTSFKQWSAISGSLPGQVPNLGGALVKTAAATSTWQLLTDKKNPRLLMCSRLYALGFCLPATPSPRNFDQYSGISVLRSSRDSKIWT